MDPNNSAFPTPYDGEDGMTLRTYLAAHAPAQVPEWFQIEPLPRPEIPQVIADLDPGQRTMAQTCVDQQWEPDDALRPAVEALKNYYRGMAAWKQQEALRRVAAWPWAWADATLKAAAGTYRIVPPNIPAKNP